MASSRVFVLQVRKRMQISPKSALTHTARFTNSFARSRKRMVTKVQWLYCKFHDNWVAYVKIWSRRSLHRFCGRAQTYRSQSDVFNSPKPYCVTLTFKTKIHRLEWFAQVNLIPGEPHQCNSNAPNFEDRSKEETEWQERCAREAAWRLAKIVLKIKGETWNNILLTFGELVPTCAINHWTRGKRICCRLRSVDAYDQQKDLNSADLETVMTTRSPTTVITANGEEATVYVRELDIFLTMKVLEDTPAVLSLRKLCGENGYSYEWFNGQKPHHIKNGFRIQCNTENCVPIVVPGQRVLPQACLLQHPWHLQGRKLTVLNLSQARLPQWHLQRRLIIQITLQQSCQVKVWTDKYGDPYSGTDHHPAIVSSESVDGQVRGDPYSSETPEELLHKPTQIPKPNKNWESRTGTGRPLLFRHTGMVARIQRESCGRKSSWTQRLTREFFSWTIFRAYEKCGFGWTQCSYSLPQSPNLRDLPEDQNHKSSVQKTQRRVPRADNFGDLITADHKVLSDNCESRNNHRYAVVVQDLATQWIQAYPCKNKTSQETQRSLQKFLEPERKPKVIYTDNSLEFGKACEDLSWNHCTSTPHRSETNGIAARAVRREKEGTSAVLLQSGLNESWWADSMECYTYLRNIQDLLSEWKTPYERRCGQPFKGPIIPFGSLVEYLAITAKDQSRIHQFGKRVLPGLFLGYALYAGGIWKGDWLQTLRSWKRWTHRKSTRKDSMRKRWYFPNKENLFFQSQMDESKPPEEIRNWEHPPWYGIDQFKERVVFTFLENQKGLFHNLMTHFRMPVKREITFGSCRETSKTAITLNPELSFTRRETNHSLFHWNILTSPELRRQLWMLCKKAASMIIGMSMEQETCVILGQVSPSLLYEVWNLQKDICGPGETDKTASDI